MPPMFGVGFLFVLINLVSYVGMSLEQSSVGTSIVTTLLAHRSQLRQTYLVAHTLDRENRRLCRLRRRGRIVRSYGL